LADLDNKLCKERALRAASAGNEDEEEDD